MKRGAAFAFNSMLTFHEMIERMNALGLWEWHERDSAWYGNLASARPPGLKLDLCESGMNDVGGRVDAGEGRQFCISARFDGAEGDWEKIEERLGNEVLPALGALDVTPTETIE